MCKCLYFTFKLLYKNLSLISLLFFEYGTLRDGNYTRYLHGSTDGYIQISRAWIRMGPNKIF